jgi:HK97 gp10 family phage protein
MEFSVQIEGLDRIAGATAEVKQNVANELNVAVYAAAQQIRTEAIKSIQDGNKSGRIYKRRSVTHRASAPGEPPASDTGRLVGSITAYANGGGEAMTVAGRGTALYAPLLEFGTSKIAPRPFMLPALEKSKAWISNRLQDALRRGLTRGR